MNRQGRSVAGSLVWSDERECWIESPAPRVAGGPRHPVRGRVWSDEDHLLVLLLALRSESIRGLTGRVRRAAGFTGAQASMGRSNALDALGLPHGWDGDGGRVAELLKVYGVDEAERMAWDVLNQLEQSAASSAQEVA